MNTHDAWEQIHKNKDWGKYPAEHVIRFVARNYYGTDRANVKILDFGCGGGGQTWYLAREGFDTYAFDISETAILKLKDRMKAENLSVSAKAMNGLELDYPDNFFDCVIDNVSILNNRMSDIKKMYGNVWNVLKVGGKFLTVVFGRETTGYGTGTKIEDGTYEAIEKGTLPSLGCQHFFEENELRQVLSETGFQEIGIDVIRSTDRGNIVEQFVATGVK